jgi:hypothetical protein
MTFQIKDIGKLLLVMPSLLKRFLFFYKKIHLGFRRTINGMSLNLVSFVRFEAQLWFYHPTTFASYIMLV